VVGVERGSRTIRDGVPERHHCTGIGGCLRNDAAQEQAGLQRGVRLNIRIPNEVAFRRDEGRLDSLPVNGFEILKQYCIKVSIDKRRAWY
jgi:hypothetical protein